MTLNVVLTSAGAVVAGALGGLLTSHYSREPTPTQTIAILDMHRVVEAAANDASLDEARRQRRAAEIGTAVNKTIDRYAASGVVVLDASAVLRAPRELYVQP